MYERLDKTVALSQGDILDECPLLFWETSSTAAARRPVELNARVLVLTQACDLNNAKGSRAVVAVVHGAKALVERGIVKAQTIREGVRLHRVFGWYFLEESPYLPESLVDLRDIHTLPRAILDDLVREGHRRCSLITPYREHLAQHFAVTYSRIALPSPARTTA